MNRNSAGASQSEKLRAPPELNNIAIRRMKKMTAARPSHSRKYRRPVPDLFRRLLGSSFISIRLCREGGRPLEPKLPGLFENQGSRGHSPSLKRIFCQSQVRMPQRSVLWATCPQFSSFSVVRSDSRPLSRAQSHYAPVAPGIWTGQRRLAHAKSEGIEQRRREGGKGGGEQGLKAESSNRERLSPRIVSTKGSRFAQLVREL